MATFEALRLRVANRARRGDETDFTTIVNDAFAVFLETAGQSYDFDEMRTTLDVVFVADATSATLAEASLTGFNTEVHHIFGRARVGLTDGSASQFSIDIKRVEWLDAHFPDRLRSSTTSQIPTYCALRGTTLHLQAPSSAAYTITLSTSHLPLATGTDNPIPSLDEALVSWAAYEVYEATEQYDASTRQWDKAQILLEQAKAADVQPGVIHQAIPRGGGLDAGFGKNHIFNLSDLQGLS